MPIHGAIRQKISTHALREEGDFTRSPIGLRTSLFLPTPSARRATHSHAPDGGNQRISTHALREEGDTCAPTTPC